MTLALMESALEENAVQDLATCELIEVLIYRLAETNGLDFVDHERRTTLMMLLADAGTQIH